MKKLDNYRRALASLEKIYEYEEPYGQIELAGIVALFETSFELAWKAMKETLAYSGYPEGQTGSPRTVLKTAFKVGMIDDEALWLEALVARNNVSHSYNAEVALEIARKTKESYYPMLRRVLDAIECDWPLGDRD